MFAAFVLATVIGASVAMPSPNNADSAVKPRTTSTPNGFAVFYPKTEFKDEGSAIKVFAYKGEAEFCQQFQPVVKPSLSFRSYYTQDVQFVLYKDADCSGKGLVLDSQSGTTENNNTIGSGYQSFQAIYDSQSK